MPALVVVDIDNTLTMLQPTLDVMSRAFGKEKISADEVKDFQLAKAFGVSKETEKMFWKMNEFSLIQNAKFNEGVYNEIIRLCDERFGSEDSYEILYLTARSPLYEEETLNWLRRHGVESKLYNPIFTAGFSKLPFLEQLQADVLIDDNPLIFQEIEASKKLAPDSWLAKNLKTVIIDYKYNKSIKTDVRITQKNKEKGE